MQSMFEPQITPITPITPIKPTSEPRFTPWVVQLDSVPRKVG